MSRRPGIGRTWYEKYKTDVFPSGYIIINGKKAAPPKYYQVLLEEQDSLEFASQKKSLREHRKKTAWNAVPKRLQVREICKLASIKNHTRQYEEQ